METNEISKVRMLYKNGLAAEQPEFADAKLREDLALLSALDRCFSEIEGQDYACQAVKEHLFGLLRKTNAAGPAAVFFFAGSPAVGKTLLAQKIAQALGRPFIRFDMSGYADKEAPMYLFGLNKSYRASSAGMLTDFVKEHPLSVILFDEIEKAHITVRNNVLQMLDQGAVRDLYYGMDISIRDCILIFTSNVGSNVYNKASNPYNLAGTPISTIVKSLEEERNPYTNEPFFSRELVSRFASGKIIMFNKLRPEILHRIAVKQIDKLVQYYSQEYNIVSNFDYDALADLILLSQGRDLEVRSVVRAVNEFFAKNFERMAGRVNDGGYGGRICRVRCKIDLTSASPEASDILADRSTARVLTFGGEIAGSIPGRFRDRVELTPVDRPLSAQEINKLSPAIAVVGVTNDNAAEAKELFDGLIAAGIPVYVYTKSKTISLNYYAEYGAVDCFTHRKAIHFKVWVAGAMRSISLSRATNKLFRANKILTYSADYQYSKRTCTVTITLSDFAAQISFEKGENSLFAGETAIPNVTFQDIIGAEEAKRELQPVIRQLKNFTEYKRNGIRIPRGIILDGPPGSGKTTVAKAVANAANLPFIALNATEFLSKFVGEGERMIRNVFATARKYAPAIIFIDEIDFIAKERGAAASALSGLTNVLLSELDGFNSEQAAPVFVIAATNFDTHGSDTRLDKAFLRRFDKKIHIDLPKYSDREKFILRELGKYDFSAVGGDTVENIAKRSIGWSLADLNLVIQNAIRHSEKDGSFLLTDQVLEEAFASFSYGDKEACDEETVRKTAYHEAGHAVVAKALGLDPSYITIAPRGSFFGVLQYSDEGKDSLSREDCLNRICIAMAGRAGEVCFYGKDGITTSASGDLQFASEMAMRMLCFYGMEEDMLCHIPEQDMPAQKAMLYERIQKILMQQYNRALQLVRDNAGQVERVASALIVRENLTDNEFSEIISAI